MTLNAGTGDDFIRLGGSNQIIQYADGDGNDTIFGITSTDRIELEDEFSTVASDNNVIVKVGDGSITLLDAKDIALNISDRTLLDEADSLTNGIIYDPKKPSKITVTNPFRGLVDAAKFSDKVTMIDASADSNAVILKGGDKSSVLIASDGNSTLIGGKSNDKFYGGDGIDVFTYTVGSSGADNFYDVGKEDIVSIIGATRDKLSFKDNKSTVTITFDGDAKSKLTVSKVNSEDPLTLNVDGETFKYGELPTGVAYDNNDKKTAINVGSTATDGVLVNAIDIVSTAKTLNGSAASGAVHLIGNNNASVIIAGDHGSTLYGGHSTKAVADKLTGGKGADVFVWAPDDGADQILKYNAADGDVISVVGSTTIDQNNFKESGKNVVLTVDGQKLTITDAQYKPIIVTFNDGETFTFGSLASGLEYNDKRTALSISDPFVGTVAADDYAPTLVTLDASNNTGAVELIGNAKAKVFVGSEGATTMVGSAVADVFRCNEVGTDTIIYSVGGGKDQVLGFDNTKDVIKVLGTSTLTEANITEKGNDLVLTVGKGTLTIKDAPRGALTIEHDGGSFTYTPLPTGLTYDNKKIKLTAAKNFSGKIENYAATVVEITAASVKENHVEIVGNDNNNVIRAGAGGSILDGRKGDDTLIGGAGSDVFVYNDGIDYISGYSAAQGDVINLQAVVVGSSIDKSNVVLTFSRGDALTIKGGANNVIDMIDVNGVESTYMFTSAGTYKLTELNDDLTDATSTDEELVSTEYWFEQSGFVEISPLDEIVVAESAFDMPDEFLSIGFKKSELELASVARHRARE